MMMDELLLRGLTRVSMAVDLPDSPAIQPPGTGSVSTLIGWGKWVALAVCLAAGIAAFALLAIKSRHGDGSEGVGWIVKVLIAVVGVSAIASMIGFIA